MSEEAGDFAIGDAIDAICDKLVRRHPHVFARTDGDAPLTSNQVIEKWETLKAREREAAGLPAKTRQDDAGRRPEDAAVACCVRTRSAHAPPPSDSIGRRPTTCSTRLTKKSPRFGGRSSRARRATCPRAEEEMGDLLFAIANLSRKLGVEPEAALRRANEKFTKRFDAVERAFLSRGQSLSGATLEEMEAEWQVAKRDSA